MNIFLVSDTHFGHAGICKFLREDHVMHNLIFSHIPIHEGSIGRFKANVHGHLHHRRVTKAIVKDAEVTYSDTEIDPRYHCVCVEHTDYAPIAFDEVLKRIKEEQSQ